MKLETEIQLSPSSGPLMLELPLGLIGLPKLTAFAIAPVENSWPFMLMNSQGGQSVHFVTIDPSGLIPGYEIEVADEDAEWLGITSSEDALVLNIVTVHSNAPQHVTANLVAPVIINRHTAVGKQIIVLNWSRFSSEYPLIDKRAQASAA
jgi:flagellar assembly factor FliW